RPSLAGRAGRTGPAGAGRYRGPGARSAGRHRAHRAFGPADRAAQRTAVHHGLPRRGARAPAADTGRDERPVAPDGTHRTCRSVQPWAPDLVPVEPGRPGQAVHAGAVGAAPPWRSAIISPMSEHLPVLICLAGPTASGKSAAALALAERWPIEIIVMDSATIYRGMDIGTAKPTADEQARVPHHLLDIRDPAQAYSAAEFARDAAALAQDIRARGRIPLLCGGTMLYYKALREGLNDLPQADPALRQQLDAEAAQRGWPALHAELASVDPATAARLAPNDSQRLQRAL